MEVGTDAPRSTAAPARRLEDSAHEDGRGGAQGEYRLADDHYIVCSDGLTKMVPDDVIASLIKTGTSLEESVKSLVAMANERGGRDNCTVILIRVDDARKSFRAAAGA